MLMCFVFAFSPLTAEAILMATTMGADRTSEFAKRRSSTAWRFPGEACGGCERACRGGRVACLFLEHELGGLAALSGRGCPNLDPELLDGERVAQERVPEGVAEGDAGQTRGLAPRAEILEDRVCAEDVRRDEERVWTVHGVEVGAVKEADGAVRGGLFWEAGEEGDEARLDVVLVPVLVFSVHDRHGVIRSDAV
jgi:hypothetical protein